MKTSQPLKWHGGKHYLAGWLTSFFRRIPHVHRVHTHGGGLAELFALPADLVDGVSEVVNDVDSHLVNFWRVMSSPANFGAFQRRVEALPMCEPIWEDSRLADLTGEVGADDLRVDAAVDFFIRWRQSRQGLGEDFATLSRRRVRRGMNEQSSAWLSAVDGLRDAHKRLRRVVVLCRDACDVIRSQDGPQTLFYCDPPYMRDTRTCDAYTHEMTPEQHGELLQTLAGIEGRFVLSGYRCDLYDEFAALHGWTRHDREVPNAAASGAKKPPRVESVWINQP